MPLSKSISNRLMLLEFLHGNHNLEEWASSSLDSKRLLAILKSFPAQSDIDVGDAGTVARFITGLCATQPGGIFTIKGTPRMHQRPIADLIEALRGLGAHIECLNKDGFLPIRVEGKALDGDSLKVNVSRSSQFLSSVLLLAPMLPLPLRIELLGKPVSRPYVAMTIALLADYGFGVVEEESSLTVHRTEKKTPPHNRSEGDWSAAFYLLLINILVPESDVVVSNLKWSSLQGDRYVDHILEPLGLGIFKDDRGIGLRTVKNEEPKKVQLNFLNYPDLAQPFIAYCAAKRITGDFIGLATLKHKESDRIEAMYHELRKVGVEVRKTATSLSIVGFNENSNAIPVSIKTYEDHRMAMSFFLLQLMNPALVIEAPEVVEKSFPEFWSVLASLGLKFEMI